MTHRAKDNSLSITVNPEKIFENLSRLQDGEKLSFSANEFALLVDLNFASSKGFVDTASQLRAVENKIEDLHSNSHYGAGWFWGENGWKRELQEAKFSRASCLISGSSYLLQASDLSLLGSAAIAGWKAFKKSAGENHAAGLLQLAAILKDAGDVDFQEDWFRISEIKDSSATCKLVKVLVDNKESRALIFQAISDLRLIDVDQRKCKTGNDQDFYYVSKRYEEKFNLEVSTNKMRASILGYLRELAIQQERGGLKSEIKADTFELLIANPSGRLAAPFKDFVTVARETAMPDNLERIISRLEESRLKTELQTALDARIRLEEKFREHAPVGKLPVSVDRAFELMTEIAGKYLAMKSGEADEPKTARALKEAEEAVAETVKRLLEATESLNYQASNELRALAMALKSVVGAEL